MAEGAIKSKLQPVGIKPIIPVGASFKALGARPKPAKSQFSSQVTYARTGKNTVKSVEKIVRVGQRVGQLKTSAPREQVKGYTRRTKDGKIVIVRPHSRKGEQKKVEEIRPARVSKKTQLRQQRDHDLWKVWVDGGKKPEDLRPLLKRFRGMLRSRAAIYVGKVPIPPQAIYGEFTKRFVQALERYDPDRGVGLGTFVFSYLDAAKRFIVSHQNVAKIPEPRVHRIGDYQRAHADLDDVLGRPPTPKEVSDYTGMKLADVVLLGKELRRGLVRSEFEEDPTTVMPSKEEEILSLFRYHLAGVEREVYDHLMGYGGKKQTSSTGKIAREVGISMSKVSRIRKSLAAKIQKYIKR